MAMRRQVYVWGHRPDGFLGAGAARGGARPATTPASIFVGAFGTSTTVPAVTSATQFVVIEHIASSPGDSGPLAPAAPDPLALPGNVPVQPAVAFAEPYVPIGDPRVIGNDGTPITPNELLRTTFPYLTGTLKVVASSVAGIVAPYNSGVPVALGTIAAGVPIVGSEVVETALIGALGTFPGRITGPNTALGAGGPVGGSFMVATGVVMGTGLTQTNYLVTYMASTAQVQAGGGVQIRVNTTGYYLTPDGTVDRQGVPGNASPYPASNMTEQMYFLRPDMYILPGQTWDLLYQTRNAVGVDPQQSALQTNVFCRYVLYDGPDSLIANKLLEMGITVTPENVDWYKKLIVDQQNKQEAAAKK